MKALPGLCGLLLVSAVCASPQGEVPPLPPGRELVGFCPAAGGRILALVAGFPGWLAHEPGQGWAEVLPRGHGFEAGEARPVDLAMDAMGRVLLLDAGQGTAWIAAPSGKVLERVGLFVAPTRIGAGRDGGLYVADPGVDAMLAFGTGSLPRELPGLSGEAPVVSAAGALATVEVAEDGTALTIGLRPLRAEAKHQGPTRRLAAPGSERWLAAEVLGLDRGRLVAAVLVARAGGAEPAFLEVLSIVPTEEGLMVTGTRVLPLPMDLLPLEGMGVRLSPEGDLWVPVEDGEETTLVRL